MDKTELLANTASRLYAVYVEASLGGEAFEGATPREIARYAINDAAHFVKVFEQIQSADDQSCEA